MHVFFDAWKGREKLLYILDKCKIEMYNKSKKNGGLQDENRNYNN